MCVVIFNNLPDTVENGDCDYFCFSLSWYLWGRKVGMEWNDICSWYFIFYTHLYWMCSYWDLQSEILNILKTTGKKSTKSTQTVRVIVLNEQTDIMTNTQTYFVKFLCIIINFDTEGHCSLHCRQEAIFHQAGSTPVSQDHSTIYNDDSWLQT